LDVALDNGQKDTAQILLKYQPSNGLKPIHKIHWSSLFNMKHDLGCDIEFVNALMQPANDDHLVEFQTSSGRTALHESIIKKGIGTVKFLLDMGIFDINAQDNHNSTPLHYVAQFCYSGKMADLLISYHADQTLKDEFGRTPLDVMFYSGNEVVFRHLLELTYPNITESPEICYQQLTQREPNNPVYRQIQGEILLSLGSIPDALCQFDLAFTLSCLAQHEQCLWRIKTPSECDMHRGYPIVGRQYKCTECPSESNSLCSECVDFTGYKVSQWRN